MGLFRVFSYTAKSEVVVVVDGAKALAPTVDQSSDVVDNPAGPSPASVSADSSEQGSLDSPAQAVQVPLPLSPVTSVDAESKSRKRRISLRPFSRSRVPEEHKYTLSAIQEREKKVDATAALSKKIILSSRSDRKAKESALVVRALIVGSGSASPKVTPALARPRLSKVKSQLMEPKSANKLIGHLRQLSVEDAHNRDAHSHSNAPIHAVCLAHTEAQEHELHLMRLSGPDHDTSDIASVSAFPAISSMSLDQLSEILNEMHIIDLVKSPDFGLGQPGDGEGILAGAVPTAETVIKGIEQITPQLLALGYATGKAITPDHAGVYPPNDRMSVLTYWWGLEIALPPPSLAYLSSAHSISGAVVNFLSALALANNGVREILPFVRYISQYIDFEFNAIKAQNKGDGVVCTATWLMPAALVPRPWDFPSPPPSPQMMPTTAEKVTAEGDAEAVSDSAGDSLPKDHVNPVLGDDSASEPAPISVPPPSAPVEISKTAMDAGARHAPVTPIV